MPAAAQPSSSPPPRPTPAAAQPSSSSSPRTTPAAARPPSPAPHSSAGGEGGREKDTGVVEIPLRWTLEEAERAIVLASLRHHRTRSRTARALGIGLRTLYTKLAAWGRDAEDAETA
jgi:DNA-binding NtrC family response regulator